MTVHGLVPQCALSVLSFSECKIAKIFQGFTPEPLWGRYTAPSSISAFTASLASCTTLFLLATLVEKPAPPKN